MPSYLFKMIIILLILVPLIPAARDSGRTALKPSNFGVLNYQGTLQGIDVDLNGTIESKTQCCTGSSTAPSPAAILKAINWLLGVPGDCWAPANSCVQLSCTSDSAIVLCNTNSNSVDPSCPSLGSLAQDVYSSCTNGAGICGSQVDSNCYEITNERGSC
ncbi:uncharacterized protein LY89DRAFT_783298 [Mollisia scopiformis]|uniref:Uncharacterized protein n=1 Tax=Mollisia scopiformis TaxID=149040 RepID=A0A194X7D0_MOLSC|nr:uncharacterized protein LY89DRAFT_783298 [Mollisia scopiformis]KUJ16078.1 hypothetical protein LY89DRAFT_783298 [Mollisia scopiformis]